MTATLVAPVVIPLEVPAGRWHGASRVLAATGTGVFAAGLATTLTVPSWAVPTSLLAAAVLAVAGGLTLFESLRAGKGFAGIGSCVLAVLLYLAVHESAVQLLSGARRSVLDYLGFSPVSLREDTFHAVALFVMAAGAFAVGEAWAAGRPLPLTSEPRTHVPSYRPVFLALLAIGMTAMLLTGQRVDAQVLDLRGQVTGQGAIGVLQQTLPLALAVGILHRHWHSRRLAALSVLGLATYVTFVQSRSLLLFVGLAVVVRVVDAVRVRRVRVRDAAGLFALVYVATLFIVAFGQWRSAVRTYGSSEFLPWLTQALPFPFQQLSSKGSLDTLDGLVLSLHVDRALVGASVLDPLKGIVNLVPTQLWADKPEFLGPQVTHYYTDFGGRSGIFLSGPGYLYIVYAGLLGMALASVALGVGTALLLRRSRRSPVLTVVVVYGLCRFLIGGDAFDLQYCLTLLLSLGVGVGAVRGIGWMHRPPIEHHGRPLCA
jgi:hypothetical protein